MVEREILAAYRKGGVAVLRHAVPPDLVEQLSGATDIALADPAPDAEIYDGEDDQPVSYGELQVWKRLDPFREAILQGDLAKQAAAIMDSQRAQFFYDQLLVKEPGATRRTPWHQDVPYWNVAGSQICSLWLALDVIPGASGLEFVRGSDGWNEHNPQHFRDHTPYADTGLDALPDIEDHRHCYEIATFDLEPGDAIVFHASTVHGAPGNAGSGRRRAYSTRWLGDDAVYMRKPGERAFPVGDVGLTSGQPYTGPNFPIVFERGV